MVRGTLGGLSTPLTIGGGHERAIVPLLVLLLIGTVGGTFTGVLILFCLAFEAVSPEVCLVAMSRSSLVVHGPLCPSFVNQGLVGGFR